MEAFTLLAVHRVMFISKCVGESFVDHINSVKTVKVFSLEYLIDYDIIIHGVSPLSSTSNKLAPHFLSNCGMEVVINIVCC